MRSRLIFGVATGVFAIFAVPVGMAMGTELLARAEPPADVLSATGVSRLTAKEDVARARYGWPTHCVDEVPSSPADYQEVFDYRRGGWAGGDGGVPIPLPDGRVLWQFGDTLVGQIDENNALLPGSRLINNSVQIQSASGKCFTPVMGGTPEDPSSFMPARNGMVFWPAGGYVDTSVRPAVVRMMGTGICVDESGWRVCGMTIQTLSLPKLEVIDVQPAPYDVNIPGVPGFGYDIMRDGDITYLYGPADVFDTNPDSDEISEFAPGRYAARVSADRLAEGPWEFWDGSSWSTNVRDAQPMVVDLAVDDVWSVGSTIRWGDAYLTTGKMGWLWAFEKPVYAWTSDSPAGPWTIVRGADGEPADQVPADVNFPQPRWLYGGAVITDAPGTSERRPMMVFSTNGLGCVPDDPATCTPDTDIGKNVMLYGPHFVSPTALPPRT